MITTTKGEMDPRDLDRVMGIDENDNERAEWVEYYLNGELVHRSVNLTLKTNVIAQSLLGK